MTRRRTLSVLIAGSAALAVSASALNDHAVAQPAPATTHHTGTLPDGATWIADVPARWNGTLVLFSHGFGPLVAQNAPSKGSAAALLAQGYALAGSSYDPHGSMWALNSAVADQMGTLQAFGERVGKPRRTIAVGQSMGGLVNSLIAQQGRGKIAGAATFCGIVAGGVDLNDYQLNAEYALTTLLPQAAGVKIRDFASEAEGAASGQALTKAVTAAQSTAAGRARIALAAALLNQSTWATGATPPAPRDYTSQEEQQARTLTSGQLIFIESGRYALAKAAGGDSGSNIGVDYSRLIRRSPHRRQIEFLYRKASLNLRADLSALNHGTRYASEGDSLNAMRRTSTNTGRLPLPELTVHTVSDQLVPVEQEATYAARVRAAGDSAMLRQAYVAAIGHCAFTDAEYVAAINTVDRRITTGRWANTTSPALLNTTAKALNLGPARFTHHHPSPLLVQPPA
ncbi:DUF6351 family protein [Actinomadura rupiterrae]|uniref:DUF6351 family protein n=1 Tax=Actinomadura rupiterrae TaxID=559627 RepID=UPI0020A5DFD7|nr:DUF6351 family protein [Actinomadura rupiterrae]MCP2341557.1 pimeloyl-ACP methyl ester carboxylesterase [Actinomadura rupiterrae]